jgi:predicted nucleotidyltransferase
MVESIIASAIKQYLASLPSVGIHVRKAVLFVSYAKGQAGQWSDIDLIIIAPEFDGRRDISLIKSLWRATGIDSRIEPIPCGEKEWETDESRPILEIARREGITITP